LSETWKKKSMEPLRLARDISRHVLLSLAAERALCEVDDNARLS
jgi:hypothetical protein